MKKQPESKDEGWRLTLRLPPDMAARIKEISEKEMRKYNDQILYFLKRAVEDYDAKQIEVQVKSSQRKK